jgi:hypothetical protein
MKIIQQRLEVKDWPLEKVGDEKFFGYIVSIGVFPADDWDSEGMIPYVDFAYNQKYERYRLPNNAGLHDQLHQMLIENIDMGINGNGIYNKVWISLNDDGYLVFLP